MRDNVAALPVQSAVRKLLRHHRAVKGWANVRYTAGGGTPQSVAVTLVRG